VKIEEKNSMKKSRVVAMVIAIGVALGLALSGCSSSGSTSPQLGIEDFAAKSAEAGVVVLDVRTPAEFAEGHLANAINIDFQSGNFEAEISALDKTATYAVYCRSGNRSGQAVKVMADLGFTNLYDMDGGVIDWAAAGKPLYTE
jgi:rhodanese-related sulfurtransferase